MGKTIAEKILESGNGINGGLLLIEYATDTIEMNDRLRIDVGKKAVTIRNLTRNSEQKAGSLGGMLLDIFLAGGLVNYLGENREFITG